MAEEIEVICFGKLSPFKDTEADIGSTALCLPDFAPQPLHTSPSPAFQAEGPRLPATEGGRGDDADAATNDPREAVGRGGDVREQGPGSAEAAVEAPPDKKTNGRGLFASLLVTGCAMTARRLPLLG